MLSKIFKIISFYDYARWNECSNYNLINYYSDDLDDDTKLLTHWLCYIADRQMAFQRIWDVGGFVFSELVDQYKKDNNLDLLNPMNHNSFIVKNEKQGYSFASNAIVNGNTILKKSYGYKKNNIVRFTSRYYPSDYFSILSTLDILIKYDFSLTGFMINQLENHWKKKDRIKRLLFSLYLLSYYDIGQPKKSDINNFERNVKKVNKRTEIVLFTLNDENEFENQYEKFIEDSIYKQKRAWCSLRDYFKSPEFNKYFRNTLTKKGISCEAQSGLFSIESFQQFELPGDVWNNNSKFRNCILMNTEYENSKKSLNKILRDYFDKNKDKLINCYPEQFDITFDFVPRMCENNNCDICPIGLLKGNEKSNFKKTCVNDKKLYCSVALTNCNYKVDCFGDECKLIRNIMSNKAYT